MDPILIVDTTGGEADENPAAIGSTQLAIAQDVDFYRTKLFRLRREIPKLLQDRRLLGGALQLLHEHDIMPSSTGLLAAADRAAK